MEDAATAEIARAQVWQWIHHGATLADGRPVTRELVTRLLDEETDKIHAAVGDEVWERGRPLQTREVLEAVALRDDLPEFLTLGAYELLDEHRSRGTPRAAGPPAAQPRSDPSSRHAEGISRPASSALMTPPRMKMVNPSWIAADQDSDRSTFSHGTPTPKMSS